MRLGHRQQQWPEERRCLVASGQQRSGKEMDAAISTALELDPRPFAYEGYLANGDDAGEGPFRVCLKSIYCVPPAFQNGGRRAAPVLGPCVCFVLAKGLKKRHLFWPISRAHRQPASGCKDRQSNTRWSPCGSTVLRTRHGAGQFEHVLIVIRFTPTPVHVFCCQYSAGRV